MPYEKPDLETLFEPCEQPNAETFVEMLPVDPSLKDDLQAINKFLVALKGVPLNEIVENKFNELPGSLALNDTNTDFKKTIIDALYNNDNKDFESTKKLIQSLIERQYDRWTHGQPVINGKSIRPQLGGIFDDSDFGTFGIHRMRDYPQYPRINQRVVLQTTAVDTRHNSQVFGGMQSKLTDPKYFTWALFTVLMCNLNELDLTNVFEYGPHSDSSPVTQHMRESGYLVNVMPLFADESFLLALERGEIPFSIDILYHLFIGPYVAGGHIYNPFMGKKNENAIVFFLSCIYFPNFGNFLYRSSPDFFNKIVVFFLKKSFFELAKNSADLIDQVRNHLWSDKSSSLLPALGPKELIEKVKVLVHIARALNEQYPQLNLSSIELIPQYTFYELYPAKLQRALMIWKPPIELNPEQRLSIFAESAQSLGLMLEPSIPLPTVQALLKEKMKGYTEVSPQEFWFDFKQLEDFRFKVLLINFRDTKYEHDVIPFFVKVVDYCFAHQKKVVVLIDQKELNRMIFNYFLQGGRKKLSILNLLDRMCELFSLAQDSSLNELHEKIRDYDNSFTRPPKTGGLCQMRLARNPIVIRSTDSTLVHWETRFWPMKIAEDNRPKKTRQDQLVPCPVNTIS